MAAGGNVGARQALVLAKEPTRFLSTVQVGITLVAVFQGAFGERELAGPLAEWIARVPALEPWSKGLSLAVVVAGLTYCSLVFGELVPKRVALAYPERVASLIAPVLWIVSTAAAFLSFSGAVALLT